MTTLAVASLITNRAYLYSSQSSLSGQHIVRKMCDGYVELRSCWIKKYPRCFHKFISHKSDVFQK